MCLLNCEYSVKYEVCVSLHVALEDVLQRSKESFERLSVDRGNDKLSLGNHVRGSWCIPEQRNLTKIVPSLILHDLLGCLPFDQCLCDNRGPADHKEKHISFVAFSDHSFTWRVVLVADHVTELCLFVMIDVLQDLN